MLASASAVAVGRRPHWVFRLLSPKGIRIQETEPCSVRPFYGLDDPMSNGRALLFGLQHVLAMFVAIITPPLIVAGALDLGPERSALLVSMALFTSGLASAIQVRRVGPFGSGLLSVQGTSFTFVPLAVQAGGAGGLPLVFGLTMACAPVEMVVSRFIGVARKLFPPVVTGTVVMLIGFSLIQVGMTDFAGGFGSKSLGDPANLAMGFFVLSTIVLFNRFAPGVMSSMSIAVGIVAGYLLAALLGWVDFSPVAQASFFQLPRPFQYGVSLDPAYLIPWMLGYLVSAIESIGDLSATSAVSKEPISGPKFVERVQGGVLADGTGSMLAGMFGAMPNTTFSQNNGVIAITGVASRKVGLAVAALLVTLGLFPKLAALVSVMPKPVLGGATIFMFAMVAVAGIRIVVQDGLDPRKEFILAVALGLGLGVHFVPSATAALKGLGPLHVVVSSGLAVSAIVATVLNLLLPPERKKVES